MAAMRLRFRANKKFRMHKKGMFLTFISIAIIAGIIIIFNPTSVDLKKDVSSIKSRVSNVNDYVFDLENVYLKRALQASGRKSLISLIANMGTTKSFLSDFDSSFKEIILEGTISGANVPEMDGHTFLELKDQIAAAAEKSFNVQTEFSPIAASNINVFQENLWFITVEADVSFKVSTAENTASWERKGTISADISIENLIDPYYLVKTNGAYVNKVRRSGTSFDDWTLAKVTDFIADGNYTHFADGNSPDFISRFTGSVTPSQCCGIESLVNPGKTPARSTSYADYLFWSSADSCASPPLSLFKVTGISSPFKLDIGHISKYNLQAETQLCPPPT